MSIIQVNHLTKRFGNSEAVKNVSFDVNEGEVFGFLGPNGAGKTTTINMLCTLLRPTSGTAILNGMDIVEHKTEVRKSIGLVFQETTLDDYLTAEQNILFHALAYGVEKDVRKVRTRELLTLMGLWDRRKDKIRT
jgi:ABC-2 type transport system ATP-binding protein